MMLPELYGDLLHPLDIRDALMSCCQLWWLLRGLDLNMLGQCLLDEAITR